MARLLKPQDTLARLAGDQFGIILLSENEPEKHHCVRRHHSQDAAHARSRSSGREIFLTASIGLALADGTRAPRSRDDVMRDAELAMQVAKRVGGDRIEVFKPALRTRSADRLGLEADLRRAIERDEITILYQPIIRLADRSVAGFEALARWEHPRHGKLAPAEFIPMAEETGIIVELGQFILDRAARQLGIWQRNVHGATRRCSSRSICRRASWCATS